MQPRGNRWNGSRRGFSLLLLAWLAVCLAMGVLELCEWARIVSIKQAFGIVAE